MDSITGGDFGRHNEGFWRSLKWKRYTHVLNDTLLTYLITYGGSAMVELLHLSVGLLLTVKRGGSERCSAGEKSKLSTKRRFRVLFSAF